MRTQLLTLCRVAIPSILVLLQQPLLAKTEADKVQQIFTDFLRVREKFVCFSTADTNRPVAFHQWRRPGQSDNELMLFVYAEDDLQLDSCTIGAFESLRNAAFEMGIEPPKVRLNHYLNDQNGNVIAASHRVYQCSVPAQLRDHRTDISYDTAYDIGGIQEVCR
jgi:hypothetical protein